ncbi:uncharacterized protein SPAPADRAFT_69505 [Spathaspora passalidarum NRRL Y-27907]|uniref:Uncharacterized protein n=1 Tax=Spathaspora passalidarum (strain NRRL Y-27907 / 11-Y1) TaxID=619300 RepID=G3AG60_SPAPN|nr:uncharacterized protein SPAPADRAFT_69505 [Spathaspora passalidarum NRRL Y-27907]EGW35199.1 hypothetical protein SPAPADRAFT_69505 [Spathaspora passalidarum NRRL Y-27907]
MSKSPEFQPQFQEIAHYSLDELTSLEEKLTREFRSLGEKYLTARLSRINTMIDKLNNSIKLSVANDKNWLKIYNFEIETINNIKTNTEDLVLMNNGMLTPTNDILKSVDEYEEELKEIFKNLQSPLDFDDTITRSDSDHQEISAKLPFPYLFTQLFAPHRQYLKTVINEKDYQTKLIGNVSKGNSVVIWKQYYTNMIKRKQELTQQTLDDLNRLYREYHHLDSQRVMENHNKYYYRSVLSPQELVKTFNTSSRRELDAFKGNHDSDYVNLDTRLIQKNKIELTSIRRDIKDKNRHVYKLDETRSLLKRKLKNQEDEVAKRIKPCDGLDPNDIEQDLWLLKRKEVIEDDDESEDYDDEDAEYEEQSPEQKELRDKYTQLLGLSTATETPLIISDLPPVEKFPRLIDGLNYKLK